MGDRKAPNLPPSERPANDPISRQVKPDPPPAPPRYVETGGPAFPSLEVYEGYDRDRETYVVKSDVATGMSLRDYFAGQALMNVVEMGRTPDDTARFCYVFADAMLKARAK